MSADSAHTRRHFFSQMAHGLGGIALVSLLGRRTYGAENAVTNLPHFPPKARRVLQIFCPGGVSHLDTWDYKPELAKRSGQPMPGGDKEMSFQGANGHLMGS